MTRNLFSILLDLTLVSQNALGSSYPSGGLLFSVDPKDAESLLGALNTIELPAAVVGELAPPPNRKTGSTIHIVD